MWSFNYCVILRSFIYILQEEEEEKRKMCLGRTTLHYLLLTRVLILLMKCVSCHEFSFSCHASQYKIHCNIALH